ncbi:MAG: Nramp family divalent metal transporter [Bacteroidetes bacterium]|nr:Nramp family divalent metal transporter [Bacteroidota bacterium]
MKYSSQNSNSLGDVHQTIDASVKRTGWKKFAAFFGPAYLVSVGYMDPGNWATDIAGGSKYGFTLLWVLVVSNFMALLLQSLSARLGLVTGLDLAQATRAHYPRTINFVLWIFAEIAIAACDLAEVLGMALGLKLLFGLPMIAGVLITFFDTFLLLALQRFGIRRMEAFIIGLISVIGLAFIAELFLAKPSAHDIIGGLKPVIPDSFALYITISIIGATVMPHNLYLHSALVQTRKIDRSPKGVWRAIRYNVFDSAIALNLALFVNAAILILAACAFFMKGRTDVQTIEAAHPLLAGLLGAKIAPVLFAIALIAAGQSSTLTGTLSGQIVMEGYLNIRLQPWIRRLITRFLAIIPAVITIMIAGEKMTNDLIILSQVILSLQLGFAIIPLIHFVSSKKLMGKFKINLQLIIPAWITAALIIVLNIFLVKFSIHDWLSKPGDHTVIRFLIIPVSILVGGLLLWITFRPLVSKALSEKKTKPHDVSHLPAIHENISFKRVAMCVDFSASDEVAISNAIGQGGKHATYILIHVTETAGARVMSAETEDMETTFDEKMLEVYGKKLREKGYQVETILGFGNPKEMIPKIVIEAKSDLLVIGAHGHNFFKDLLLGTTVETVRHRINIPVLIVRKSKH